MTLYDAVVEVVAAVEVDVSIVDVCEFNVAPVTEASAGLLLAVVSVVLPVVTLSVAVSIVNTCAVDAGENLMAVVIVLLRGIVLFLVVGIVLEVMGVVVVFELVTFSGFELFGGGNVLRYVVRFGSGRDTSKLEVVRVVALVYTLSCVIGIVSVLEYVRVV